MALLSDLKEAEVHSLAEVVTARQFAEGDFLLRQGDAVDDKAMFYVVESGWLSVRVDGEEVVRREEDVGREEEVVRRNRNRFYGKC